MRYIFTCSAFFLSLVMFGQARLNGAFDYGLFKTTEGQAYVEAYISIFGGTFAYSKNANGTYSGELEIALVASSDGKLQWYDKYKLNTGEIAASDTGFATLLDTKRFGVPEGTFRLDLVITDLKSNTPNFIEYADSITVSFSDDKPQISTPVLVNRYSPTKAENVFSKAGIDIIPNTTGFFAGEDSVMAFYAEVYQTAKYFGEGERFVVSYHLKSYESGNKVPGTESIAVAQVKPVYGALFPISLKNVPPGNYSLVFEVRNKLNEPVTRVERVFQRGGKVNMTVIEDLSTVGTDFMARVENTDSLIEFIRCLDPISMSQEQNFAKNVIKNGDKELMKKYIVSFWLRRNPNDAYKAWMNYKAQVSMAQKLFGTQYLRAYNTDRGRVFLQYGPPNVRAERPNEPFAYPYEIWQYYELYNPISQMRQTNRMFVFWNRNAATNNYELLHSNAIMEQKNERWEMVLYNRGKGTTDIDQTSPGNQHGGWSRDIFVNPR
ncbi:MAG: GWxTD domain-containing protein [Flavobacteriales bacterium]|nr:GWxTD domain-containing protein [Flavobacteriales bacterium]